MKSITPFLTFVVLLAVAVAAPSFANDQYDTPGLVGYDPVAYFTDGKPMRGDGHLVAVYEGVTYAFTSKEHQKMFEANPQKYLPAYGGYCAFGVAGELCSAGHQLSSGQAIPRFGVISRCPRNLPSLEEWLRL